MLNLASLGDFRWHLPRFPPKIRSVRFCTFWRNGMSFARLIAFLPLIVLIWTAGPQAYAADNEKVAAELRTIIDSGEPVMGDQCGDATRLAP